MKKQCSSCNLVKPARKFHKRVTSLDGLMSYCIECNTDRAVRQRYRQLANTKTGRWQLRLIQEKHEKLAGYASMALAGSLQRAPIRESHESEQ